jgi:hypothetical protein
MSFLVINYQTIDRHVITNYSESAQANVLQSEILIHPS